MVRSIGAAIDTARATAATLNLKHFELASSNPELIN
jgi:hypothetical protein